MRKGILKKGERSSRKATQEKLSFTFHFKCVLKIPTLYV